MSGRLKLRRGVVVAEQPLTVEIDGAARPAWADTGLLGEMREGDEVVVNVAALDLDLGSGGFDVVHVNLTRGLEVPSAVAGGGDGGPLGEGGGQDPAGEGGEKGPAGEDGDGGPAGVDGEADTASEPHVMKLNYTSLQHAVDPVERPVDSARRLSSDIDAKVAASGVGVLVLPLHGHLAPAAWAFAQAGFHATGEEGAQRLGYVQTGGGALPGALSRDVAELRERGLLCGHITAASAYGGEHEAISVAGAIDSAVERLGWDAVLLGPGPGIIGSGTVLGHGGVAALESAHAALALGLPTLLSPRLSAGDPRERHRGLSHHTTTVLGSLLAPVEVAVPDGAGLTDAGPALDALRAAVAAGSHRLVEAEADLDGYAAAGLPVRTMGRGIEEDRLFFAAPLAAGTALARHS